jgi:hypothetical protein
MSRIIFSLYDAPVTDMLITDIEDITEGIGVIPGACGGPYATITALPGGAELISGCTWGDVDTTGLFDPIEFIYGAHYTVDVVGTARVIITLDDVDGTLPNSFTYGVGFPLDYQIDPACSTLDQGSVCRHDLFAVGIGSGIFESVTITETVPEPSSMALVIAVLAALVMRVRHRWRGSLRLNRHRESTLTRSSSV